MENEITFFLKFEGRENVVSLSEWDTVGDLKLRIHQIFGIPQENQLIEGWRSQPQFDNTILQDCADVHGITSLNIREDPVIESTEMDVQAAVSCSRKINYLPFSAEFNCVSLRDALNQSCLTTISQRRVLLLYLHNGMKPLSETTIRMLAIPRVKEILRKHFFLLGWDVEDNRFHTGLVDTLIEWNLSQVSALVRCQYCAILLIQNIDGCITLNSCVTDENISDDNFCKSLERVVELLIKEKREAASLENVERTASNENDMDSNRYQQLMADMLGDRDYDRFEFNQHEQLRRKILFSMFGPPEREEGYDEKKTTRANEIYEIIKENSNTVAEHLDQVEISFIYNCCEPLPEEKLKRAEMYHDYNPRTDMMPVPIFVLRKCQGSNDPCRLFIDDSGRVYSTWEGYIEENKLHACKMVLPRNGRYQVNEMNEVLLEYHLSPACGLTAKILRVADMMGAGAGLASGAVFLTAAFSTIAIAPALLVAAGGVGVTAGVYAIGRSLFTLFDRQTHRESMSFQNSEARGAYLNILAGALGFAGSGANMALSQLAAGGFEIGQGAAAVVNTIGIANLGASGASIINSGYDVFDQWYNENRKPSLLTIVQLSSSVLFFGNAVYNFRSATTIVEESQARTLKDYQESLRSNRHRKTFNKMMKETIRQNNGNEVRGRAEVISAVRDLPNKDDVFAALTRSNKAMNRNGVRFHASGGEIQMNGQTINLNDFTTMTKKDVGTFLSKLPSKTTVSPSEVSLMSRQFSFKDLSLPSVAEFAQYAVMMLGPYEVKVQNLIMITLTKLFTVLTDSIKTTLKEIFPNQSKYHNVLTVILEFFGMKASDLEEIYEKWRATGDRQYFQEWFRDLDGSGTNKYKLIFEEAVKMCFEGVQLIEETLEELLRYFNVWLAKQIYEFRMEAERAQRRWQHSSAGPRRIRLSCRICDGYFYQSM